MMDTHGRAHTFATFLLAFAMMASTAIVASFSPTPLIPDAGEADIGIVPGSFRVSSGPLVAGESAELSLSIQGDASSGTSWVKRGVVLDVGGTGEERHVFQPTVVQLDDGTLMMFYAGVDSVGAYRIFRASSPDGLTWTKLGMVLDTGTPYANNGVSQPRVVLQSDGTFQMWYVGQNYEGGANRQRILVANSTDGGASFAYRYMEVNFGEPTAPDSVQGPFIFREGDDFQFFYSGIQWGNTNRWINRAHKTGLYHPWQFDGIVLTQPYGGCGGPFVRRNADGLLEMYYANNEADGSWDIRKAVSVDGLSWTKVGAVLLPTLAPEGNRIGSPNVFGQDGALRMWYGAWDGVNGRIMYAEQASADPGVDATCDVSIYDGAVAPENLAATLSGVMVAADGQTPLGLSWTPTTPGTHTLIAVVDGVSPTDPDATDNTAYLTVEVAAAEPASVSISKSLISGITDGFTHTYYEWEMLITVANFGGRTAEEVTVHDVLPAELELLASVPSAGVIEKIGGDGVTKAVPIDTTPIPVRSTHLTWFVGDVAPGESETLLLLVCTRVNGGGNQEFTTAGTYILNEGAFGTFLDSAIGDVAHFGPSSPITVTVADQPEGEATEPVTGEPTDVLLKLPSVPVRPVVVSVTLLRF